MKHILSASALCSLVVTLPLAAAVATDASFDFADNVLYVTPGDEPQGGADAMATADGLTFQGFGFVDVFGTYGPGDMTLTITSGPVAEDGGVMAQIWQPRLESVTVPSTVQGGLNVAVAYYQVPDEFNRGSDAALPNRDIVINLLYEPDSGGAPFETNLLVRLYRPALLLIHGLWSSPATWALPLQTSGLFPHIGYANYRDEIDRSAAHFAKYLSVIRDEIDDIRVHLEQMGIESTQIDVAGHSMGGLLARFHAQEPYYYSPANRGQGDFRKLITLDSPHLGSPLANLLQFWCNQPFQSGNVRFMMSTIGLPIDRGAIDDLAVSSPELGLLLSTQVPSHAMVGIGGGGTLSDIPGSPGFLYALLEVFDPDSSGLFSGLQHDGIVPRDSQEVGQPPGARTVIGGFDGLHVRVPILGVPGNTGSTLYSDRILELVDTPVGAADWAMFPAGQPGTNPFTCPPLGAGPVQGTPEGTVVGLTITSPTPGTIVTPGGNVVVTVVPDAGLSIDRMAVAGRAATATDDTAPFAVTLQIPLDESGAFPIRALGVDGSGQTYISEEVILDAVPDATLVAVDLRPDDPVLIGPGAFESTFIIGAYDDGVERRVDPNTCVFASTNPSVASVSSNGTIEAMSAGVATISVDCNLLTDSEVATVTPALGLTVNSVDDVDDGLCNSTHCSLREALLAAAETTTRDAVTFAIPGSGPFVIGPTSPLPVVTSPVVIDGLSQPGADCTGPSRNLLIEIDGALAGSGARGLVFLDGDSELRGVSIHSFDGDGVVLSGGGFNQLECNSIGSDTAGTTTLGNGGSGVVIEVGSGGNTIGGVGAPTDGCYGPCNVIAFNGGNGVTLAPTAGSGNAVRGNSIYRNGDLGIDLAADGFTDNDEDDIDTGPNGLQNWPLLTGVMPGSPSSIVTGQFLGAPNSNVTVEFFSNTEVNGDPAGTPQVPPVGEGQTYLGSLGIATDPQGEAPFAVSIPTDLTGLAVTATASDDSSGNTSEFSYGFTDHITHAVVSELRVVESGRGARVEWKTVSEAGSGAFVLYRVDGKTGELTTLASPILALEETPQGARYWVEDPGVRFGERARYVLAESLARGGYAWYGPFNVQVEAAQGDDVRRLRKQLSPREPRTDAARKAAVTTDEAGQTRHSQGLSLPDLAFGDGAGGPPDAVKIAVKTRGLYRVQSSDIASILGLSVGQTQSKIRQGKMLLRVGGMEVPWFGNSSGSTLYFFGESPSSPYAAENVYWLYDATGTVMSTAVGGSPIPAPGGSFASTERFETDVFAATNAEPDPDTELWFWKVLAPGSVQSFSVGLADLQSAGGQAELSMDFFSLAPSAGEDQAVEVRVNGSYQGDLSWQGSGHLTRSLSVSVSSLLDGANTIELTSVQLPGQTPGQVAFYVDSLSVEYPRFYEAVSDALLVRGDTNPVVTASGFVQGDLEVLDVSDPLAPVRLTGVTIDGGAGNWRASFQPGSPTAEYVAASLTAGALDPTRVWGNTPSTWQTPTERGNYLVITDADLEAAAQNLASYRAGQGYETAVVLTEDIYDEFNYGVASPHAIRDFVLYALQQWALAPEFVVLAGSGTYDYRDVLGNANNLVPPLLVATGSGLFSSDKLIADIEGDGTPEAVVGRIPATTNGGLQAYVDKLTTYEGQVAGGWLDDAVLLADDPDGASAFGVDILDAETHLAVGYVGHPILLEQLGTTAARQSLFTWFDSGMGFLYYLGHGGLGQLAAEGLLTISDVAPLDDSPLLPVVIAPTCTIARFEIPAFLSLAESLVLEPDGGAVAVWSASGLSQHGKAVLLGRDIVDQAFDLYRTVPLGEALNQAVDSYTSQVNSTELVRVYNLLGDPALVRPF